MTTMGLTVALEEEEFAPVPIIGLGVFAAGVTTLIVRVIRYRIQRRRHARVNQPMTTR